MVIAILATAGASIFQLFIPRYVGDAVDNAQGLLALNTPATTNAEEALFLAAFMIVTLSVARGLLTMLQNYHGEATGIVLVMNCVLRSMIKYKNYLLIFTIRSTQVFDYERDAGLRRCPYVYQHRRCSFSYVDCTGWRCNSLDDYQ